MLPKEKGGVVDSHLRVYVSICILAFEGSFLTMHETDAGTFRNRYGTKGLRVCDVSTFGRLPDVNLVGPVYAVAERGAQIIREDWDDLSPSSYGA